MSPRPPKRRASPRWCVSSGLDRQALVDDGVQADLLLGNNVLPHVPDLHDFVGGAKLLAKPEGIITFDFQHLMRMMAGNQFDTIYQEHYSYLTLTVVGNVFAHHGLTIFDVEELPTHGGSIRVFARHADASEPADHRSSRGDAGR